MCFLSSAWKEALGCAFHHFRVDFVIMLAWKPVEHDTHSQYLSVSLICSFMPLF